MYKVVMYGLLLIVAFAFIFSATGILSFPVLALLSSFITLSLACGTTNVLLAKLYQVPRNYESALITTLILFLILAPSTAAHDLWGIALAGVVAMASKYVFAIRNKLLFNPAACGLLVISLLGSPLNYWWVGATVFLPIVTIVGLLVVRKVRRFSMFVTFFVISLLLLAASAFITGKPVLEVWLQAVLSWPIVFFGTIMLTEPLTTPPTQGLQMIYGAIVALIFASQARIGSVYTTPEFALMVGNLFSYLISSHQRLRLVFKEKKQMSARVYDFIFSAPEPLQFKPGQYMEWTLSPIGADIRGNRRYFTIASSPTEKDVHLGVRIQNDGSSFKKLLADMKPGDSIIGSQVAGEFVLPEDSSRKLVFIAGGIGITPFRSMIKYLVDTNQKRDIVLFYSCAAPDDFAYQDIFAEAEKKIGLKVIYLVSEIKPEFKWSGKVGHITDTMVRAEVTQYQDRLFYLSGPNAMVEAYAQLLHQLKIPSAQIIKDYFPGF